MSHKYNWEKHFDEQFAPKPDDGEKVLAYCVDSNDAKKFIKKFMPKCNECWDKGWGTAMFGYSGMGDFPGDKGYNDPVRVRIVFCDCERGKQLESLWDKEK